MERRHPFWDKRLVEFCLALPPTQKFHHGWDRVGIRRAMANIIPKEIQWRVSKASLSAGFNHRMVTFGQTFLNNYTHNNLEIIEKYVDIPTLQKAFEIICHQPDHEYAVAVWSTVILSLWLTMPTETWGASSNGSIPSVRG
ncbi:asparagine synthase-related protein [Nostoc sp.]